MKNDYYSITEISGDLVSQEQVERMAHRYIWAGSFCNNKKVIEVGCGTGQGLGYLQSKASKIMACDYCQPILTIAKNHYQNRIIIEKCNAEKLKYKDNSADVIIIFEAIYLLPNVDKFILECQRILTPKGKILIAMANKDLYDFNKAPYSTTYFNPPEITKLLNKYGFSPSCFGYFPANKTSIRQRILRPIKMLASKLNLIPKSMNGKKIFKRIMFGNLVKLPFEIAPEMIKYNAPTKIPNNQPDKIHKVLYVVATKKLELNA